MEKEINIWQKEFWTQKDVAGYFRVVESTVINWRKQGLLQYWRAPGSKRVLYYRDEILNFINTNTKREGGAKLRNTESKSEKRVKPCENPPKREWRI